MRRGFAAVIGAVMLSWAGTSFAVGLSERASSSPHGSQLHLMPRDGGGGGGGGAQMEDSTRSIVAVALTFFVGFGAGHFVLGDDTAWLFLGLDIGVIAGAVGLMALMAATAATFLSSGVIPILFFVAIPLIGLADMAIRIWEFVDVLYKSGIIGGGRTSKVSDAIVPATGALARSAFEPAMANALSFRF